jgi:hypothetical protein
MGKKAKDLLKEASKDTDVCYKFVLNIDVFFAYIIALKTDRWV